MKEHLLISIIYNKELWSIQTATIMIICNILSISLGRYAIQIRNINTLTSIANINGFGITELLATTSLGHIIGAGTILGLQNISLLN
jgi:photosystem I subunit X|uniref:Photosystem I reaction center subunit PsaK n=1 Tax=Thorea hispida TaxID=202687 RepID=A0A1C9CAF5_9FLOR|nr:photosystem I subunit X [Thorea hispida]AOM65370.1 photosystem I subunit X [Thorea hispida]ARX95932.1 photosystem I subunit X [Thorea hispida]